MWFFKRKEKPKEERNYEGAGKGHRFSSWANLGGNKNSNLEYKTLRDRSRFLVKNNPYAAAAVRTYVSYIVSQGVKPHSTDKNIDVLLKDWADTRNCDFFSEQNLYGLQSTIVNHIVTDGEIFIKREINRDSTIPLKLRVLEVDYLDESKNSNDGLLVNGIEFDAAGRRIAYYFLNSRQSNMRTSSTKVLASDVIHLYRKDSASQTRGIPWLSPVILKLKNLDEYQDAELLRHKLSACFIGVWRDLESNGEDPFSTPEGLPMELVPGSIIKAPSGQTLEFTNPQQNVGFASYIESTILSVASGTGVPYMFLSSDFSKSNFSSSRMNTLHFAKNIDAIQLQILLPNFCLVIEEWFFDALKLKGNTHRKELVWSFPSKDMVDQKKSIEALKMAVDAGFRSHSGVIREFGEDPENVYSEQKSCNDTFKKYGLNFNANT